MIFPDVSTCVIALLECKGLLADVDSLLVLVMLPEENCIIIEKGYLFLDDFIIGFCIVQLEAFLEMTLDFPSIVIGQLDLY